jgi:hypothetical protein
MNAVCQDQACSRYTMPLVDGLCDGKPAKRFQPGPNLVTPTGVVHASTFNYHPFGRALGVMKLMPMPACGAKSSRYLIPTTDAVTCKRCGS